MLQHLEPEGNSSGGANKLSTTNELRGWITEYRRRGLAVARVQPGEKNPIYLDWPLRSLEAEDFSAGDLVGIITGTLSGNLVCVDLDSVQALQKADQYLPVTGMVSGRPGKPRSSFV